MLRSQWQQLLKAYDVRWDLFVPGDYQATLAFCIASFIEIANESIADHGYFAVALSGGSTPKAIYQGLAQPDNRTKINWSKVLLFWSDERCVPKTHPDSNYRMAMEAGFASLPIPKENIFPIETEGDLEKNARDYEHIIREKISLKTFDLVMLGMGDDGHTASLFPKTHGLHAQNRLVIPNFLPDKEIWRMTLTYECINAARNIIIYVMGKNKAEMLKRVLLGPFEPDLLPIQKVGTPEHKALWLADDEAASTFNH